MTDLRYRYPNYFGSNPKLAALSQGAGDAEGYDDPVPELTTPPFHLQGAYPALEFAEALDADEADMTVSSWGNLTPRMPYEPKP
jgi:hypothetical protein